MDFLNPQFYWGIPTEVLWFVLLLVNFFAIILIYRHLGRLGLYIWIPIAAIIANIQVVKLVTLFGMTATLGNIVYATSFLVTDILSENYGKAQAKKAVIIGFISIIAMTVLMNLALLFKPSPFDEQQAALAGIFSIMPRIALGSIIAYLVSQRHDVWAYHFWQKRWPADRFLFIRNNLSTMVSQLIDTVIFTLVAFAGVFGVNELIEIIITTYVLKWIVAALDTPFIYWAKRIKKRVGADL